jgi:hypothetical protein
MLSFMCVCVCVLAAHNGAEKRLSGECVNQTKTTTIDSISGSCSSQSVDRTTAARLDEPRHFRPKLELSVQQNTTAGWLAG